MQELPASPCPGSREKSGDYKEMVKWATACARSSQWHRVEDIGNRLGIQFPNELWGPYFLSLSAEHAKDWPRARWMAELAVKKGPYEGMAYYQLGRVQWAMDDKTAAVETLKKSVEINPSLTEAHVLMGKLALLADKNSEANRHFQEAYAHDAKHLEVLLGLAEVSTRAKNWLDTQKYLRAAVQAHSESLQAHILLAQGQEGLGKDINGALESYREIQRLASTGRLDKPLTFDLTAKIQFLKSSLADEMKKKVSERQPSGKEVSK